MTRSVNSSPIPTTAFATQAPRRSKLSVLVGIASYGTAQDHFLREVVGEYQRLDMDCRIVVLSNIPKKVTGAETVVGLPSRNSYSLPFAHRKLFRDNAGKYDLYVYTEDDTLITPGNLQAFLEVQRELNPDEVAGFLRSELSPTGERYIVSANHHFRWRPDTVRTRGPYRFAEFSNQHSGCYVLTRVQLERAIASGGFGLTPREGKYGMLETAASEIYTECGLKRVICLSRIQDFIVPHLANKYHGLMGVRERDFFTQVNAVMRCDAAHMPSLIEPETRAPGFRWSKHLYRAADKELLARVPSSARRVLSVGATMGENELALKRRGISLVTVPLDGVFAEVLARRGVETADGDPVENLRALAGADFDVVVAADILHLAQDPVDLLRILAAALAPNGVLLVTVAHTSSWVWQLRDWRHRRWRWGRPNYQRYGAHPVDRRTLTRWAETCGLVSHVSEPEHDEQRLPGVFRVALRRQLSSTLVLQATPLRKV